MKLKDYCFDGEETLKIEKAATGCASAGLSGEDKAEYLAKTEKNIAEISLLQEKLYAEGREGVVIVLQAMDAAGKDSTIKHVMGPLNPQGVDVVSFKQPTSTELSHDFLWRANQALPARGKMVVFNRSYYEDVLVVQVHQLQKNYKMADRCRDDKDFFEKRYRQIRDYERYLDENSYRVVKIFLNESSDTQKKRFLERIDDPAKNWKFSAADLKEREHWGEYQKTYEEVINATATGRAPWYVLPADQKWFTRYLVSEVVRKTLADCEPQFPEMPEDEKQRLASCKAALLAENGAPGSGEKD